MDLESELWRFALSFYRQPDVANNLLKLQNSHQCNINQLLFALWAGRQQLQLHSPQPDTEVAHWQRKMSSPLRQLRYQVRAQKAELQALDQLYAKLQSAELACEQVELALYYQVRYELAYRVQGKCVDLLQRQNVAALVTDKVASRDELLSILCSRAQSFINE